MADPVEEFAAQQLEEFDGIKPKPTTKEGLDLGDQDEKKLLEELKIEPEPLMKETLGDKIEAQAPRDNSRHTASEYGGSADMKRIIQQRNSSQHQQQQPQVARQSTRQERGKEGEERKKKRKGQGERERAK